MTQVIIFFINSLFFFSTFILLNVFNLSEQLLV